VPRKVPIALRRVLDQQAVPRPPGGAMTLTPEDVAQRQALPLRHEEPAAYPCGVTFYPTGIRRPATS
jgi:hypothetical protein